jgi:phosphatidylinositol glycan class M
LRTTPNTSSSSSSHSSNNQQEFRSTGTNIRFLHLIGALISEGLKFGVVSAGLFIGLNVVFYHLYGELFLQEAFLHHLTRKDPRHNFSIYFYHVYLTFMDWTQQPGLVGQPLAAGAAAAPGAGGILQGPLESGHLAGSAAVGALLVDPSRFAFLFQWLLLLVLAVTLHRHLPFCWMIQTMAFVALNKVGEGATIVFMTA